MHWAELRVLKARELVVPLNEQSTTIVRKERCQIEPLERHRGVNATMMIKPVLALRDRLVRRAAFRCLVIDLLSCFAIHHDGVAIDEEQETNRRANRKHDHMVVRVLPKHLKEDVYKKQARNHCHHHQLECGAARGQPHV